MQNLTDPLAPRPAPPLRLGQTSAGTSEIPAGFSGDLQRAVEILKGFGCNEIYLFGSLARGEARPDSDIDLAVRGCPPRRFFRALGSLLTGLEHPADLIDLDCAEDPFARRLLSEGNLVRLA